MPHAARMVAAADSLTAADASRSWPVVAAAARSKSTPVRRRRDGTSPRLRRMRAKALQPIEGAKGSWKCTTSGQSDRSAARRVARATSDKVTERGLRSRGLQQRTERATWRACRRSRRRRRRGRHSTSCHAGQGELATHGEHLLLDSTKDTQRVRGDHRDAQLKRLRIAAGARATVRGHVGSIPRARPGATGDARDVVARRPVAWAAIGGVITGFGTRPGPV